MMQPGRIRTLRLTVLLVPSLPRVAALLLTARTAAVPSGAVLTSRGGAYAGHPT